MPIYHQSEQGIFLIQAKGLELVLGVLPTGHLAQLYAGAPLQMAPEDLSLSLFRCDQNRGLTVYTTPGEFKVPLGHERIAYPTAYSGDYREPALMAVGADGTRRFDLKYQGHRCYTGGFAPEGMPHLRLEAAAAVETGAAAEAGAHAHETLEIDLYDAISHLTVTLRYTALATTCAIATGVRLHNGGPAPLSLEKAMSACLALPDADWQLLQLSGDWIRERQLVRRHLTIGRHSFGSTRGASSAHHNPFAVLARPDATEHSGEVLGMSLVYSGSFHQGIEVDEDSQLRWMTGIHPEAFRWQLDPGAVFETPQAVIGYSTQGLNALSHVFHQLVHQHLIPPFWREATRPVVLNNWEATYFDFNQDRLLKLADKAATVGVELFVLDDGWFSTRNDDLHGLGDWRVNTEKLTGGLVGLAAEVRRRGLKFGLWIEPEMVNADTPLFKTHPEWVIGSKSQNQHHNQGHTLAQARNQYVLDFANPEVVDHIYQQLIAVLDPLDLDYMKWDMNRNISEGIAASLPPERMGELMHRYLLGVYTLYRRLTERYPRLLIESCAAGGGRFDLGMLYFAPQAWASDNSDGISRLSIQYGTSLCYPINAMGAHISAVPNHQTRRSTSLDFRSSVSLYGAFGVELNLLDMDPAELEILSAAIASFKALRPLLHGGDFYRLLGPFANGPAGLYGQTSWQQAHSQVYAWSVIAKDKSTGLVTRYQPVALPNPGPSNLKLQGLSPATRYQVVPLGPLDPIEGPHGDTVIPESTMTGKAFVATGAHLMQCGILVPPPFNGIDITHHATGDAVAHSWFLQAL